MLHDLRQFRASTKFRYLHYPGLPPPTEFQICWRPQITGGNFTKNEADFGGFLYKQGKGITSCEGASVLGHKGVDGGAIYAVDGATLEWECDLLRNSALVGSAM